MLSRPGHHAGHVGLAQQRVERLPIAALGSGHERAVVGVSDAVTVVQRRVLVGFGQGAKVTSERVERYGF